MTSALSQSLYRRIWRWHFYASLIVMPFVVILSASGILYLFEPHAGLMFHKDKWLVENTGGERVSYDRQRDLALLAASADGPSSLLSKIEILDRPDSASAFYLQLPEKGEVAYFINPYTGDYLGQIASKDRWTLAARKIHSNLLVGDIGGVVLETAACWTLVMMVTGLALWWPRGGIGAVLKSAVKWELNQKGRSLWKEVHTKTGVAVALLVIGFVLTGLPWSTVWKAGFNKLIDVTDQTAPWAAQFGAHFESEQSGGGAVISLDAVVMFALDQDLPGKLTIRAPRNKNGVFMIRNKPMRSADAASYILDQYSGNVISEAAWADYPAIQKIVATGIDLHEGRWGGIANLIINFLVAAALIVLMLTGLVMWWIRRPSRAGLHAPKAPASTEIPKSVIRLIIAMGVLFPTVGVSLLLCLGLDWMAERSKVGFAGA